ncbi:MAG: CCA tRNA nucleotidyltransferase [Candidatus Kerfeldbacteria bacterium]|nr:CCA tRNA nucleotidyltransferase [Candidatus Kerfeldbacteria bacterium]
MQLRTLTQAQRRLLNRLATALKPGRLFLVGGTVRDALLDRPIKDVDVVVSGLPLAHVRTVAVKFGSVANIGTAFGVLRLTPPKKDFVVDLALPRTEIGRGLGGHKDFSFAPDPHLALEKDLARRDFTINAIAVEWPSGTVVDPFGGQRDLKARMLRTVGRAEDRFAEDYVRLLRLVRFAVTLGLTVHPTTATVAKRMMGRLNAKRGGRFVVPREAVADQLVRTFSADPMRAFDAYDRFGLFDVLLPEVAALRGVKQPRHYHSEGDVWQHTQLALAALSSRAFRATFRTTRVHPLTIIAALLHDIGKPATRRLVKEHGGRRVHFWGHDVRGAAMVRRIAQRLRLSSTGIATDELTWLIRHHLIATINDPLTLRRSTLIEYFFGERGRRLIELTWVDQTASFRPGGRPAREHVRSLRQRLKKIVDLEQLPPPLLTGHDLMTLFNLSESPALGALLKKVRERQLDGELTTSTAAVRFVAGLIKHR